MTKTKFIKRALDFNNYYDFSNGIDIKDGELKAWIKKGIKRAVKTIKKKKLRSAFSSTSTGNAHVFIEV